MASKKKTKKKAAAKKPASKKKSKKAPAKKTPKKKASSSKPKKQTKKAAKKKAQKKAPQKKVKVKGTRHEPSVFLLVHIPASMSPIERFERFEEPIDDALSAAEDAVLGEVTGGGSSLDDKGDIVSCDIEVEVHDVARCLPILRRVLTEGGAPKGTVVTRLAPDGAFEVLDEH